MSKIFRSHQSIGDRSAPLNGTFRQKASQMVSDRLRVRLEQREAVLRLLDRRRAQTGDPRFSRGLSEKGDLLSIRRPVRHECLHWRRGELKALTSIGCASPKRSFGNGNVSNPVLILGEFKERPRDPAKLGHGLARLKVVAEKFAAVQCVIRRLR